MDNERGIAGRYRLDERLGSGGEGMVWKATDQKLNRYVALKRAAHGGGEAIARIESEGTKLAQVSHPNVVTVYDVVPDSHPVTGEEERWLVMEYLEGVRLSELSDVPVAAAARYGAQLAGGLMEVHDAAVEVAVARLNGGGGAATARPATRRLRAAPGCLRAAG